MASVVSNYEKTQAMLRDNIKAGVPLIVVRTAERHRVEQMVAELAASVPFSGFVYTDARQVQPLGRAAEPKDVESDPLPFVRERFLKDRHMVFLLADTKKLGQDSLYTRELLAMAFLARETTNTLVVVAAEDVWPRLSAVGQFVRLGLPDSRERLEQVSAFAERFSDRVSWDRTACQEVATLTRGLTEIQISNLLRSALVGRQTLSRKDVSHLASSKELLFAQVPNVMPVAYDDDLQVAGLDALKAWLDRKRSAFFAPSEELEAYGLTAPKGVLLVGVPGCGKSFSAKMVAARWALPLFRFDIASVYDKYVGETERQMQEALEYVDNVAPCVLWVDEIEKALSTTAGESDVGRRILGQFLFWLQESRARVFLVATANDVMSLPPELFRKGRFAETFFVDLPSARERASSIDLYARLSLHHAYGQDELERLAQACEGFSYSDIEQAVKGVAETVVFGHAEVPTADELRATFETVIPISEADERVEAIRAWGSAHARPASSEVSHV